MAAKGAVLLKFLGDTQSLEAAYNRVVKGVDATGKKVSAFGRITAFAKAAAGPAALAGGIAVLTKVASVGWGELQQGQKVAAQTAAVLKSTGGIARVTAGDVDRLGTSLMRKSGTDDEAIKSGANLLLTFKNVRNEAGAGRDVFNQATTAALDLSVAFKKDMSSSAVLVGKALNDPIAGITALAKVGVTFNQGQKDQIKAFMEAGNVMGAQKIILGELNSQVSGSAAAFGSTLPGKIAIAKESFSNLAGSLMGKLLPVINTILTAALKLLDAFANIGRSFEATNKLRPLDLPTATAPGAGIPFKISRRVTAPRPVAAGPAPRTTVRLPGFAHGGLVSKPTLAMVGEQGPEAIVPLGRGGRSDSRPNLTVNVTALDPQTAAAEVIRAIDAFERRNGQRYARI